MNMELRARIFVIISVSSLILYLCVGGLNILPSVAQSNSKVDEVNQVGLPVVDEAKEAASRSFFGPVLSSDGAKESPRPVSLDEAKQARSPISSPHQLEKTLAAPASSSFLPVSEISSSPEAVAPTTAEDGDAATQDPSSLYPESQISSSPEGMAPTIDDQGRDAATPDPSSLYPESQISFSPETMTPTIDQGGDAAAGPVSSPISRAPAPSGYFDQDIALAIEARIKQSQRDSQVAMDEAEKLLEDPDVASSETGKCLGKCVDKYAASLNELNRAVTDLGVRDVRLLADDFGAVEMDILTCQACFMDEIGEDSPFKALEEATAKAARECLTVMDYAV